MNNNRAGIITACFCLLLPLSSAANGLDLTLTSDTIVKSFNRNTALGKDVDVMPIYEYLQAEYSSTAVPELHAHAYGWYRADLGDLKYFDKDHTGELLYGYLELAKEYRNINAKLGRQAVFNGPSKESFDGLMVSGDLLSSVNIEAFYGLPVGLDKGHTLGDDETFGGRLSLQPAPFELPFCLSTTVNFGVSYLQINSNGVEDKKLAGLDYYIDLPGILPALAGQSVFNLATSDWSEHFLETYIDISKFNIRPYLQQANLENYISSASVAEIDAPFFNYQQRGDNALEIGADVIWQDEDFTNYGGKLKFFDYSGTNETSYYISGLANLHLLETVQGWIEAGRMQGEQEKHRYFSGSLGLEFDLPIEFHPFVASTDFSYLYYDKEIYLTSDSIYLSFGISTTLLDESVALKFNTSYHSDPYYKNDFQTLLTLSYLFSLKDDD